MKRLLLIFTSTIYLLAGCGTDWYSETYEIHTTQSDFVRKVDSLKIAHPEYNWYSYDKDWNVIKSDYAYAPYERMGRSDLLFYSLVFYIPSENKLFSCHIIPYDSLNNVKQFTLRFIAILDTNSSMRYEINTNDLSYKDNARYKRVFENQILNSLNVKWDN